jgi:hypothetical protein
MTALAISATIALVAPIFYAIGRWTEREAAVMRTHDITQTLRSVLRSRRGH